MKRTASISLVFIVHVLLSVWLVVYTWHHRNIIQKKYDFTAKEAKKFRRYSRFLYSYGLNAWFQNDSVAAARFFRQALSQDVLYIDAWIRLAQAELVLGNSNRAGTILTFTDGLTENIYRWKWRQTLLAHDLGMKEILFRNINFLVNRRKMTQDAFQLLDTNLYRNTMKAVEVLDQDNLIPFLQWLIRWRRVDDAEIVWCKIPESVSHKRDICLEYIHFLIGKNRVRKAAEIWRSCTGTEGLTNAGFEEEITGLGFNWRCTANRKNKWTIRRSMSGAFKGTHSLKIIFEGKENISFVHLYQIVPVDPLKTYRLTYDWKSKDISTDQGPFIDIYGYDCKGLYFKGPMIFGTNGWKEQHIEFTVSENCNAVVIRLHRAASRRFDNKIAGTLWLDNFELEESRRF